MAKTQSLAHELADQKANQEAQAAYLAQIEERDRKVHELQLALDQLDTQHTQELKHALDQNSTLRADLAVSQRMRLTGTSCPGQPASGQASSPSSLGDGAGVELSPATRQAVFDLRASLISDRAKLDYLQDYIRKVGLSPPNQ